MSRFIEVTGAQYKDRLIVNLDNIAAVFPEANMTVINGVHGGSNGLLTLEPEDIARVLKEIEIIGKGGEKS